MKINLEHAGSSTSETLELEAGSTVQDVLDSLGIHYSFVITLIGDDPAPLDQELEDGDTLKIITVVSGG
jgi:sulfur carrier protein ThiS